MPQFLIITVDFRKWCLFLLWNMMVSMAFCLFSLPGGLGFLQLGLCVRVWALFKSGWLYLFLNLCLGDGKQNRSAFLWSASRQFPAARTPAPLQRQSLYSIWKPEPGLQGVSAGTLLPCAEPQGCTSSDTCPWCVASVQLQLGRTSHRSWESENVPASYSVLHWILNIGGNSSPSLCSWPHIPAILILPPLHPRILFFYLFFCILGF